MKRKTTFSLGILIIASLILLAFISLSGCAPLNSDISPTQETSYPTHTKAQPTSPAPAPTISPQPSLTPTTLPTTTPTPGPTPSSLPEGGGVISGDLCFPSQGIPPLIIYARNVKTGETIQLRTHYWNISSYRLRIPISGRYKVFAWTDPEYIGGKTARQLGGVYSCTSVFLGESRNIAALPASCDKSKAHEDHKPLEVAVYGGRQVTDVHICDFYCKDCVPPP